MIRDFHTSRTMIKRISILVFYQNLRFHDQPLLAHALQQEEIILPIFINDPLLIDQLGGASQWWLYQALVSFQQEWEKRYNLQLILRTGSSIDVLQELVKATNASSIYLGKRYTALEKDIDKKIHETFTSQGLQVQFFNTHLLSEPQTIRNQQGNIFQVFTPFWKSCGSALSTFNMLEPPQSVQGYQQPIYSEELTSWQWGHNQTEWGQRLAQYWQPSEEVALDRLTAFIEQLLKGYGKQRNLISTSPYTSQLSPYIRWGQLSVRKVFTAVQQAIQATPAIQEDGERFMSELGWREFSYYLLVHYPTITEEPLQKKFKNFPWKNNLDFFKKWQQGKTGYPIVDAGMRQLWLAGWLPNRLRMVVASFLMKDLFVAWQYGVAWFADTLVDADPANNANSWQWVAGCGVDAAPYFRIFNPVNQGKEFDPQGNYIKKYVPELQHVPISYLHEPWKMPAELQQAYELALGQTYPFPIVDHATQRNQALVHWKSLEQQ